MINLIPTQRKKNNYICNALLSEANAASLIASDVLWVFGFSIVCSIEGDLTKNERHRPTDKAIKKANKVVCHPFSVREYVVNIASW